MTVRRGGKLALGLMLSASVGLVGWWVARHGWARTIPVLGTQTVTILSGVHHLGGLGPSPAYAMETPAGVVLIDSGLESDAAAVKKALAKVGLDWRRVRAILLTHVHGDHTGGAERLRAETRARVYAGRGDAAALRVGGPKVAFFSNFDMPNHEAHPTTVDVELAGGEVLEFGGVSIQVIAAPGHTPGSLCYLTERAGRRLLLGGDVVMHPNTHDSLGTYTAYLAPRYRGNARDFLATVRRLRTIPVPDVVLPGHPVQDPPRTAQLAPGEWRAMLDEAEAELGRLVAHYEADGPGFLDGQPKRLRAGLFYLGDRDGRALYALAADGNRFLINAPGGPGLFEFARERLASLGVPGSSIDGLLLTSTGPDQTGALEGLTKSGVGVVIAPGTALELESIRALCRPGTRVVAAADLAATGLVPWPVEVTSYRAGGPPLAAYQVVVAGKKALFTGGGLVQFDRASVDRWRESLGGGRDLTVEFLGAVQRLGSMSVPDLWLPKRPAEGQNAYLYDHAWNDLVQGNHQLGYYQLAQMTALPLPSAPAH